MTPWLSLAVSLVAVAIAVIVMRRMIDRRAGSAAVMDEIRREVAAILTEMNQTTERNIELIEDRVRGLQEIIGVADKRLGTLRRESERQEHAGKVYSHLSRAPRPSTDDGEPATPDRADSASRPGERSAAAPRQAGGLLSADSLSVADEATPGGSVAASDGSAHENQAAPGALPGVADDHGVDGAAEQPESAAAPQPTMKERVLGLYRQGVSVERIASRVGTAVSEIELIVSLGDR